MTRNWIEGFKNEIVSLAARDGTPFYFFNADAIVARAVQLMEAFGATKPRALLSVKTTPCRDLIRLWNQFGWAVEVISEFELLAVLREGIPAERIVVNGVGKVQWLEQRELRRINVNFDSLYEVESLKSTGGVNLVL
jgi:diaminopimelate decarboxylase